VERPQPLEPDQVARSGHLRHEDLPFRRHRRKPHQEAVQIRRQVLRQEVDVDSSHHLRRLALSFFLNHQFPCRSFSFSLAITISLSLSHIQTHTNSLILLQFHILYVYMNI